MTTNRLTYFDFLRGVAILMVVGIHTYTLRPFEGGLNILQIGAREALNFAVPLFLAISGFFIAKKDISDNKSYVYFLKKQLPRVYIPAVLWSIPMLVLWLYQGQDVFMSFVKVLGCMTFGPYYFIVLIIQLYLLHPIIKRMAEKPILGGGILLLVNTVFVYLLVYVFDIMKLPATISVGPFVYWVIFYFMGVYLSDKKREYSLLLPSILIVIGFVSQIFETKYLMLLGNQGVGLKISSWVYSAGVILLLFSSKVERTLTINNRFNKMFVKLGIISFGVYLIHVYSLMIVLRFVHCDNWIISFIIVSFLTIGIVLFLRAIIPAKYWKFFGII